MKKVRAIFFVSILVIFSASCSNDKSSYAEGDTMTSASDSYAESSPMGEVLGRDIEKWEEHYPLQAASNQKNYEMEASPTGYGGSVTFQRWDLVPSILTNFQGIAFSKDYKEDRGHVYAWDDIFETERTNENSPGACITCKTSDVELIFEEYGWDYASMKMYDFEESGHSGIDCFACHDPDTKYVRVVQPAFIEAMEAQGVDLDKASRDEMNSYVCAQCHSEYYFQPGTTKVIHPWAEGLGPDEMYSYYSQEPDGFTGDFTNPISDTRQLKAQHPDYEIFQSGIHAAAGIACVDCHMPQTTVQGKDGSYEEITQHWVSSPLKNVSDSCLGCHQGKTESWMVERVQYIQDAVYEGLNSAGDAIEEAHYAFQEARDAGMVGDNLIEAEEYLREAQWYWDFTASENSGGFHNSELCLANLNHSIDLAYKAILTIGL